MGGSGIADKGKGLVARGWHNQGWERPWSCHLCIGGKGNQQVEPGDGRKDNWWMKIPEDGKARGGKNRYQSNEG